jgi:hypothetical protein
MENKGHRGEAFIEGLSEVTKEHNNFSTESFI